MHIGVIYHLQIFLFSPSKILLKPKKRYTHENFIKGHRCVIIMGYAKGVDVRPDKTNDLNT